MAFPARYDINYYMGDTHEFRVYPLDSSGAPFPLAQYADVRFTIAERRGTPISTDQPQINGYAAFSLDRTHVLCSITPANSNELDPSKKYVYDVQISRAGTPYDSIFTLLTGNISIEDQVTLASASAPIEPPGPITELAEGEITASSISISWSAPISGGTPTGYLTYILPYSPTYENTIALGQLVSALGSATPFIAPTASFTFTETTAVPALEIPSLPLMPGMPYIYAVVAQNVSGISTPAGNFNVAAGTIDEVFTVGGS